MTLFEIGVQPNEHRALMFIRSDMRRIKLNMKSEDIHDLAHNCEKSTFRKAISEY